MLNRDIVVGSLREICHNYGLLGSAKQYKLNVAFEQGFLQHSFTISLTIKCLLWKLPVSSEYVDIKLLSNNMAANSLYSSFLFE